MSRQKLSEYKAKSLLIPEYNGTSFHLTNHGIDTSQLDEELKYIIKVDQGVKKRGKSGLIRMNVDKSEVNSAVEELAKSGFTQFIAEPIFTHDDNEERYVSFERTREGIKILYSDHGGVFVEDDPTSVKAYVSEDVPLPKDFVTHVINVMNAQHFAFVEINPLIVRDGSCILLDAAVLVDSAGAYVADWNEDDLVDARKLMESEKRIAELNDNSPAAFSFRILNANGALWFLLSGGGASITIADETMNQGKADVIANYGEYSGGPSTEETYLYTKQVLSQMLQSTAPKKALVIAGGVANFTDVKKTFSGIIQALFEVKDDLVKNRVRVFVRRGGPNEKEGLALIKQFLSQNELLGSIHGSEAILTTVVDEALEYIDA